VDSSLDLIDWNYWQASMIFAATSSQGATLEIQNVCLTDIGHPLAEYNVAFIKRPEEGLDEAVDAASDFYGAKQHPFRICIRSENVEACGELLLGRDFARVADVPGMRLAPLTDCSPPRDLVVRPADDPATLEDFQTTAFSGFGLPAEAGRLFLTEHLTALPGFLALVGYRDGQPVCTSALYTTADVAGIYWVATLEDHRKRGLGEAITWAAVGRGRAGGYRVASLQASAMGRPVYERMGFEHDRSYAFFESPPL